MGREGSSSGLNFIAGHGGTRVPALSAGRELGVGPADPKKEGLDPKKAAFNSSVKALDPKNEALSPKTGLWRIKVRVWALKVRLGPSKRLAGS